MNKYWNSGSVLKYFWLAVKMYLIYLSLLKSKMNVYIKCIDMHIIHFMYMDLYSVWLQTYNMKTEIAVKPAGFKITMISEAMPVANSHY